MELAACHLSGAENFELAAGFWGKFVQLILSMTNFVFFNVFLTVHHSVDLNLSPT
jgi:hypothetical protein